LQFTKSLIAVAVIEHCQ